MEGGATLLHTSFSNVDALSGISSPIGPRPQAYPDNLPAGDHPSRTGAAEVNINTLGYKRDNGFPMDSVYHLSFTFLHTNDSPPIEDSSEWLSAHAFFRPLLFPGLIAA